MIIYTPHDFLPERIKAAQEILESLPVKYAFITGSFLYSKKYNDIDVFILSRTKKHLPKNLKITFLDFNDLSSLLYHSLSKSCVAKSILPTKPLKVTLSDYWQVLNETIPTILNTKEKKDLRNLFLYSEYFRSSEILDSYQLQQKIVQEEKKLWSYLQEVIPANFQKSASSSYLKRFFYTQAGYYKNVEYPAQKFLYQLTHQILAYGPSAPV